MIPHAKWCRRRQRDGKPRWQTQGLPLRQRMMTWMGKWEKRLPVAEAVMELEDAVLTKAVRVGDELTLARGRRDILTHGTVAEWKAIWAQR